MQYDIDPLADSFEGCTAVVTGGGAGMGRELVIQLAAMGCHVAACDLYEDTVVETMALAGERAAAGVRLSAHSADVADEEQMNRFAADVAAHHGAAINLLFNNAGIGGGGSFLTDERDEWEATFDVCWKGVYLGCRVFMPMLVASDRGHVVNTSSVNGFWASLGVGIPHTAYSAAKFAVKGFTEALLTDFRVNAPHLQAHVVMPGHIGTSIALNSAKFFHREAKELTHEQLATVRERLARRGMDVGSASDDDLRLGLQAMAEGFRDNAPMTAAEAARVILEGVAAGQWRILVGTDAHALDELVREMPEHAYLPSFSEELRQRQLFGFAI
jgi:NAD(P)-dependent dehydrogenase (short-subunit alcohol dehydrogenase family)